MRAMPKSGPCTPLECHAGESRDTNRRAPERPRRRRCFDRNANTKRIRSTEMFFTRYSIERGRKTLSRSAVSHANLTPLSTNLRRACCVWPSFHTPKNQTFGVLACELGQRGARDARAGRGRRSAVGIPGIVVASASFVPQAIVRRQRPRAAMNTPHRICDNVSAEHAECGGPTPL